MPKRQKKFVSGWLEDDEFKFDGKGFEWGREGRYCLVEQSLSHPNCLALDHMSMSYSYYTCNPWGSIDQSTN